MWGVYEKCWGLLSNVKRMANILHNAHLCGMSSHNKFLFKISAVTSTHSNNVFTDIYQYHLLKLDDQTTNFQHPFIVSISPVAAFDLPMSGLSKLKKQAFIAHRSCKNKCSVTAHTGVHKDSLIVITYPFLIITRENNLYFYPKHKSRFLNY